MTGRVVATVRSPGLEGVRMVILQPLDERLEPVGNTVVACDAVQAGPGDVVTWVGGREAALALEKTFVPVDATVVGHMA